MVIYPSLITQFPRSKMATKKPPAEEKVVQLVEIIIHFMV